MQSALVTKARKVAYIINIQYLMVTCLTVDNEEKILWFFERIELDFVVGLISINGDQEQAFKTIKHTHHALFLRLISVPIFLEVTRKPTVNNVKEFIWQWIWLVRDLWLFWNVFFDVFKLPYSINHETRTALCVKLELM